MAQKQKTNSQNPKKLPNLKFIAASKVIILKKTGKLIRGVIKAYSFRKNS
jgi:hypothetical protein